MAFDFILTPCPTGFVAGYSIFHPGATHALFIMILPITSWQAGCGIPDNRPIILLPEPILLFNPTSTENKWFYITRILASWWGPYYSSCRGRVAFSHISVTLHQMYSPNVQFAWRHLRSSKIPFLDILDSFWFYECINHTSRGRERMFQGRSLRDILRKIIILETLPWFKKSYMWG